MSARAPLQASFALDPGTDAEALLDGLAALLPTRRLPAADGPLVLLDTPDGRLAAGGALLSAAGDGRALLRLQRPGHAELSAVTPRPDFAADAPEGPLRDALQDLCGPRRLQPVLDVDAGTRGLDVLDGEGKTVARLRLAAARVRRAGSHAAGEQLPALLTVAAVRGHSSEQAALVTVLRSRPGLRPIKTDAQAALREAVTRTLPAPPPAPGADVTRRLRADEALRRILRAHLATMRWNESGLRADIDTEFLHDWRVAVRRTRSVLAQLRDIFPETEVARFREELGWLARLTGTVRDLDVFLLMLDEAGRGQDALTGLLPLADELRERRAGEQQALVEGLDSLRAATALRDWEAFLQRPAAPDADEPGAARPLGELAARRALKLHRRITEAAAGLPHDAPATELHALRIECKKLRYVLDAARRVLAAPAVEAVLAVLKRLQSSLGDAHDAHVQRELLEASAGRLAAAGRAPPETMLAVGRLAERLRTREAAARAECTERFAALGAPDVTAHVRALWKARAR